ncbi:MAG: hypothetical protein ACK5T0_08105 [Vampirovibrionales bacterium]
MDLDAIKNSVTCKWSEEDEAFIVTSPLCINIAGVEEKREDAYSMFYEMLESSYEAFLQGKFKPMKKAGRKPKTGAKILTLRVDEEVVNFIKAESSRLQVTQGQVVSQVFKLYRLKEI